MKIKVNSKKCTVMLAADKYFSMLKEMEDMRHDLALYREWHIEDLSQNLDLIATCDEYAIQIAALQAQVDCAEKRAEDATYKLGDAKQTIANLQEFRRETGQEVDEANRTIAEMAELLVAAQRERDEAREEVDSYRIELMDRDARIDELDRRIEWLLANSDPKTNLVS